MAFHRTPEVRDVLSSVRGDADSSQVFVANPNKPPEIARILRRNKDRLLVFLKDFHNDKDGACALGARHAGVLTNRRRPVQRREAILDRAE